MPITAHCPGCRVRLTFGDDRAGATVACPQCRTSMSLPNGSNAQPKPRIEFLCPHCSARLSIAGRKAGAETNCPKCSQPVIVPTPTNPPRQGILIESSPSPPLPPQPTPKVENLPQPSPFEFASDTAEEEEDEAEYDFSYLRKRRKRNAIGKVWRVVTLSAVAVAGICFFLPWVRYTIILPKDNLFRSDRIEFASQSGFEATFGLASLHPALEVWARKEAVAEEIKWKREGKNPLEERLRQNKPYMALWLLLYPLGLGAVGLLVLTCQPDRGMLMVVSGLLVGVLLVLFVQFGVLGSPGLTAIYEEASKENAAAGGLLLLSLLLDVTYTPWFALAVISLVLATLSQLGVWAWKTQR